MQDLDSLLQKSKMSHGLAFDPFIGIIDMGMTATNVVGGLFATVVVAKNWIMGFITILEL